MVATNINKVFCTCSVAFFKADSSLGTESSNGCVSPGPGYDKNNPDLNLISLLNILFFLSSRNKQSKKKSQQQDFWKEKLYNATCITLLESSTGNGTTRHLIRRSNKNDPQKGEGTSSPSVTSVWYKQNKKYNYIIIAAVK